MRTLYPEITNPQVHSLPVGNEHVLYVEECGTRQGLPVVFLHGGPGSGCKAYHRQFFDPARYRIVLLDQRGCGRSRPQGCTEANTTSDLVADLERIRTHLGIDRWVLFGGSWGSTLALIYAQTHPDRVLGMILRGTFLARQIDLDWFFKIGVNHIFPDYWQKVMRTFSDHEHADMIEACYRRVRSGDPAERLAAARAWSEWTGRVVTYRLPEGPSLPKTPEEDLRMLNDVMIETHYAQHRYFIDPNQILRDVNKLPRVPTTLIHGRADLTCTVEGSWSLHQALPHSELTILRDAGHLASEPLVIDALVTATDAMAARLS